MALAVGINSKSILTFGPQTVRSACPDNIPIEFYQTCWDIIKKDLVELFDNFYNGNLDVSRMDYGIITLLPKIADATKIQQFRPICLLNCLYKILTKTLTLRLELVVAKLVHREQTAFIKGRNIMSGIMVLHEVIHETRRKKEMGIILKLDFEKAYDKVNWESLFERIRQRGFCVKWCNWIK